MRGLYDLSPAEVVDALEAFCGTPNVTVGEAEAVKRAFRFAERGLDFADALHLALAKDCEALVTFERKPANRADGLDGFAVRLA